MTCWNASWKSTAQLNSQAGPTGRSQADAASSQLCLLCLVMALGGFSGIFLHAVSPVHEGDTHTINNMSCLPGDGVVTPRVVLNLRKMATNEISVC